MDFPSLQNHFLLDALRQHGVTAQRRGDWIIPADRGGIPAQAIAFRSDGPTPVVLFELRAVLPDGRMLIETIAGVGETDEAALAHAQSKFLAGPFHPVIEGLYGVDTAGQVNSEQWRVGERDYTAYLGTYLLFGARIEVPAELRDRIHAWVAAQPDEGAEFHWCRVFRSGSVTEVLWDNATLEQAERELAALPWPEVDGYASVRTFLLLRGPASDPRVVELMDTAVQLFMATDEFDDYREELERSATPREAQLATEFMQIAFGRALIERLFPVSPETFCDEFDWQDGGEIVGHDRLSTHPYYRAALRATRLASFAALETIGSTSAEFHALNQAIHALSERGEEPDNGWFSALRFSSLSIPRPRSDG